MESEAHLLVNFRLYSAWSTLSHGFNFANSTDGSKLQIVKVGILNNKLLVSLIAVIFTDAWS